MLVPPLAHRREIDRKLVEFFHHQRPAIFRRAVADFCRYYAVKAPRIHWFEYIDWGKAAGKTFEDGRIHLVHPENWQRGRVYNSERMWVQTVYHELGHYLFWTDAERKADVFTQRMVRGLRRTITTRVIVATRRATRIKPSARAVSRKAVRVSQAAARPSRTRTATGNRRRVSRRRQAG